MRIPKNPFLKAGEYLAEKRKAGSSGELKGLAGELNTLSGGDRTRVKQYYAEKIADVMLVFTVMAFLSVLVLLAADRGGTVENNALPRPGYGRADREEELTVQAEGEEEAHRLTVPVQAQRYTKQQVKELLEQGKEQIEAELAGENPSLDEVRTNLNFPDSLADGAVSVGWMTIPYGIVEDDGTIAGRPEDTGTVVEIQAALTCQGEELIYETAAKVYPPILPEDERLWQSVRQEVENADSESCEAEALPLPEQADGRRLTWRRDSSDYTSLALALTVLLPFLVWYGRDQKVHQRAKERRLQLDADYARVVWKLTMLLGAGLTIHNAFARIAAEYQRDASEKKRYVYEEMVSACIEMKSGVAESTAYENFGRRCGLPAYIKLGSLLAQNLKKGSKGLASILEKEAETSMEERKNAARKLGEQAGTKLLFPMILMFGIVLVILIVPAFLSF